MFTISRPSGFIISDPDCNELVIITVNSRCNIEAMGLTFHFDEFVISDGICITVYGLGPFFLSFQYKQVIRYNGSLPRLVRYDISHSY